MGWRKAGRGWALRSGWARNGCIPGPREGRLSVLLPGEGKEEAVVVVVVACSRRQRRKTGTRGKKTSQCRSNGYLDCCIEAGMQEMEGRSGNPVTKSGLSLGRPAGGLGAGWARWPRGSLRWRGVAALGALNSRCLVSRPCTSSQV